MENYKRIEGVTYSVTSFGMKVGAGLGGAVTGIVLAMGNYDGSLAVQSDSAITAIMAICAYDSNWYLCIRNSNLC